MSATYDSAAGTIAGGPGLMVADDIRAAFAAHTAGQDKFTRRMAIDMADMDGSTPRALIRRLEVMGLLRTGSWAWFAGNGGITSQQIRDVRAGRAARTAERTL